MRCQHAVAKSVSFYLCPNILMWLLLFNSSTYATSVGCVACDQRATHNLFVKDLHVIFIIKVHYLTLVGLRPSLLPFDGMAAVWVA